MSFEELEIQEKVFKKHKSSSFKKVIIKAPTNKNYTPLEIARRSYIKRKYKISYDKYIELYNKQEGCCAICGIKKEMSGTNGLHIDHNHTTNKIREFLCVRCNCFLGFIETHGVELMNKVVQYMEKHNKENDIKF